MESLFDRYLDAESADPQAWLATHAPMDSAVRDRVAALLAAHKKASDDRTSLLSIVERLIGGVSPPNCPRLPQTVGPYRILSMLGEGGFGVVYLAERRNPMIQRVALKIIKPGMDSKAVVARFEQERQALALMNHPNVARVYDGGMTSEGRPYFVMEYVDGEPLTEYCDRNRLTIRQRLELFTQVCEAVQHAHMKGIIHRDIKPGNILVGQKDTSNLATHNDSASRELEASATDCFVKVIDFGVAKAVSHTLTEQTIYTEHGQLIGTPEYMSPEQAEVGATDIDTRADVYSLGVVLYELVAGVLPIDPSELRSRGYFHAQRIAREVEFPRPSHRLLTIEATQVALVAERRRTKAGSLADTLRLDLDWIPLKATRKNRSERYQTPIAIASDIRAYLEGRAIAAAPPSSWYKVKRFLTRSEVRLDILLIVVGIAGFSLLPALSRVGANGAPFAYYYLLILPEAAAAAGVYGAVTRGLFGWRLTARERILAVSVVFGSGSVIATIWPLVIGHWIDISISYKAQVLLTIFVYDVVHPPMLAKLHRISYPRALAAYLITSTVTYVLGIYALGGGVIIFLVLL